MLHGTDVLSEFSRSQIMGFAEELEKEGYVVFVPADFGAKDGAVGGEITAAGIAARTANMKEYSTRVAEAVAVIRKQGDADGDKAAIVGFSLGGGLALERAEASKGEVKAAIDFYGSIGSKEILDDASKLPSRFVFHNPKDAVVPRTDSDDLLAALGKTTVPHDHLFLDDPGNVLGNQPFQPGGMADKTSKAKTKEWLKNSLK